MSLSLTKTLIIKGKASSSAGCPPQAKGDPCDTFHGRQSQTDSQPGHTPAKDRSRSASRSHPHQQKQQHHNQQQQPGQSHNPRTTGSSHHAGNRGGSRARVTQAKITSKPTKSSGISTSTLPTGTRGASRAATTVVNTTTGWEGQEAISLVTHHDYKKYRKMEK